MTALHQPMPRSAWRWFPWYVVAGMAIVIMANGALSWYAISTFPGLAENDVFDHSNAYDTVLAKAQQEAALGWSLTVVDQNGHEVINLTDRRGHPLSGAAVEVTAQRPLGPDTTTRMQMREITPGRYEASEMLQLRGQWTLLISARLGDQHLDAARRVVVP